MSPFLPVFCLILLLTAEESMKERTYFFGF